MNLAKSLLALVGAIATAAPSSAPEQSSSPLDQLCVRFDRELPREYHVAVLHKQLADLCDKAYSAGPGLAVPELDTLSRQLTAWDDQELIRGCKKMSLEGRDTWNDWGQSYAPGTLAQRWKRTYTQLFRDKARTEIQPDALRAQLSLTCLFRDPEEALRLPEALAANLYFHDAVDILNWIDGNRKSFGIPLEEKIKVLRELRASIQKAQSQCPESPLDFSLPNLDSHSRARVAFNKGDYDLAGKLFATAYCESGDRKELINASMSYTKANADGGTDSLTQRLSPNPDAGVEESLVAYVAKGTTSSTVADPAILARYIELADQWQQGNLTDVNKNLVEYEDITSVQGSPVDANAALWRYTIALILNGRQATDEYEGLQTAMQAAKQRAALPICAGIPPSLIAPDRPPLRACQAPSQSHASDGKCSPRQRPVNGVCCYGDMTPNEEGICIGGKCPDDMVSIGGGQCDCERGKLMSTATEHHCCWRNQVWRNNACVGTPKCEGQFPLAVGNACWEEPFWISIKRQACDTRTDRWAEACGEVAAWHQKRHEPLDDNGLAKILELYLRACKGGQRGACWKGAQIASRQPKNSAQWSQAKEFYREMHIKPAQIDGRTDYTGTFGFSRFVENETASRQERAYSQQERAHLLEGPCLDPAAYRSAGSALACEWLADYWASKKPQQAHQVRKFVCLHGLEGQWENERELGTADAVRRQCDLALVVEKAKAKPDDWESIIRSALRAVPDSPTSHAANSQLRDELSGQPLSSRQWCGRVDGRPRDLDATFWSTFRCWPKAKAGKAVLPYCLEFESYSQRGRECPGRRNAANEQLCCPVETQLPALAPPSVGEAKSQPDAGAQIQVPNVPGGSAE